jgi:SOS-response transcriptional repressor LexA
MNSNIEFLNYIYQNAEMGKDTINQLIGIVEDKPFKQALNSQLREYNEIFDLAGNKIEMAKKESKDIPVFSKISAYIMININTMMKKNPSHVADMIIKGSTMGIVDITKKLKEYKDATIDISDLANRLLKLEQQNVEEMKKFL